jgi:hypothetical protein
MPPPPGPPDARSKLRRALGTGGLALCVLVALGVAALFLTLMGATKTGGAPEKHAPEHLVDPYLPRRLPGLLEDAGFSVARREVLPILNAGYHSQSFSAGVIKFVARFVPGHRGVTEAEAQAWAADLIGLGRKYFFSLNRYLFLAVK